MKKFLPNTTKKSLGKTKTEYIEMVGEEKNCEVLGCSEKAVKEGNYCKTHNNGMIGCSVMFIVILLYCIYYLITKI